jgi:6-phosphogluconate dehydrogenase
MPGKQYDVGLIGLAVMGQNLALNMERNGLAVGVYNRTETKTKAFLEGPAAGKNIAGYRSLAELISELKVPRRLLFMVQAGSVVDELMAQVLPHLESGDMIMDGGNSLFWDTERRSRELDRYGIQYLGIGISGGGQGALWGPSIMPGGHQNAYKLMAPTLKAVAAKVDGEPCVAYIGPRGAGHFVKMVHNGIEYGDMQLIAEAYDILSRGLRMAAQDLHAVFAQWNEGVLSSYLTEITADILSFGDRETGQPLVDLILDKAEQKGTGRHTAQSAMDLGVPVPTISAAVEARTISAFKSERQKAAGILTPPEKLYTGNAKALVDAVGDALYASRICSYSQGFAMLHAASQKYEYGLDKSEIARIWRGGCIIRTRLLDHVRAVYAKDPELTNLLLAPFFRDAVISRQQAWRQTAAAAAELGIPAPAISASLAYRDAYGSARLPANLIQAQRDYFGAHTYRRVDRDGVFHTRWTSYFEQL